MTKSYEDYEQEYNSLLSRIRSFLAQSPRTATTLAECRRLLNEAKRTVTALRGCAEIEGDAHKISQCQTRERQEIAPLEQEIMRSSGGGGNSGTSSSAAMMAGASSNRSDLFYQPPDLEGVGGGQQMSLDTQALLQSSEDLLLDSQAILSETEQIGMDTLYTMGQQREQLQMATEHMNETSSAIAQASAILKRMRRKILKNKLALQSIVTLLVLANCFVLYLIAKKHSRHHG